MGKGRDNLGSISNILYTKLRDLITYGELSFGEKIIESKVVRDFNASRTPFREAIKKLEARGFVETIHNKGTYVRKISMEEVGNIYDVLSMLEGYAARLAAKSITHQQIEELEKLNDELKQLDDLNKYKEYIEKNVQLHFLFPQYSGNDFLLGLIQELRDRIFRYRFAGITIPGHIESYLADHEAILSAIKERNPERVEELMRQHIQNVKNILINFLREFPL